MRRVLLAVAIVCIPAAATAQNMNAQRFYERATGLKKRGMMAIFAGGEIKALMTEGQAAGKAAGAAYDADKKAGRPTRFCPPPGPRQMNSNEFISRLGEMPAAERSRINMTEATTRILTVKFPCKR